MKAAYIGRIYIDNINAFQRESKIHIIKDDGTLQQWTVIVGENNAGKTSLLKAVAGLEPTKDRQFIGSTYPIIFYINYFLSHTFSIDCEIWSPVNSFKSFKNSELKDITQEEFTEGNGRWGVSSKSTDSGISAQFQFSSAALNKSKNFQIYGYGVSRKIGNKGIDDEKLLGKNARTLLYNDKQLEDFTDWLFQLDYASKNSEKEAVKAKATDRINHIKNLIVGEIFPDISDLRFTTTDDLKNLLEFKTKDGWFQLHQLGYGYQTTLAWIFDLSKKMMERYPECKQPLCKPAVVLIDEIDLHLHPAWQRRIINYLSDNFTATQFIVTTHSPHVLQELKEVNLVQLKRENGATKIICRPNSSFQGWTIEEILNDVLETPSTHSVRYEELMQKFDKALDNEDFKTAHETFETLSKILHPNSPDRKILEIQLSQLTA